MVNCVCCVPVVVSATVLLVSCSGRPSRIKMPKLDPDVAAAKALDEYDADQDGALSAAELERSPGLKDALPQLDTDRDGRLTAEEIAARLNTWLELDQALHVLPCQVSWRDQPLVGAKVRFIPESFLGDAFRVAEGTTDKYGTANIIHAPEDRPDPEFAQGVRVGIYRVEISKERDGKQQLPAKYNTDTILGLEVAAGARRLGQGMVTFDLKP